MAKSVDKNIFNFEFRLDVWQSIEHFIVSVNCYFVLSD